MPVKLFTNTVELHRIVRILCLKRLYSFTWHGCGLNGPRRIFQWRASLVPAAAVIPAPLAYMNVAVVTLLVVGSVKVVNSVYRFSSSFIYPLFFL